MEAILVYDRYSSHEDPILINIHKIVSIESIYTLDHKEDGTRINTGNDSYNVRESFDTILELLKRYDNFRIAIPFKK